jgi:hypothetical protein
VRGIIRLVMTVARLAAICRGLAINTVGIWAGWLGGAHLTKMAPRDAHERPDGLAVYGRKRADDALCGASQNTVRRMR